MKTAAIYCRVSTEDQEREGTSLETQKESCIAKASELSYETPGDYIYTEAWTGTDTDRPKLNDLRSNIKQRNIDAVICYSTDRLARNPIHIAIIAEECQKRDIELIFVTEPLDNSPEGQLIRYVKGYAAQIEHEKIRERTMRGKKAGARMGKLSTGGIPPFGYSQVKGEARRSINEPEAEIVRAIFKKLAYEGYTMYRIAGELNAAGITGPRGGRWSELTIHRMVNNTAYMGVTYAFRYEVIEPKRPKKEYRNYKKTTHIFRDKSEWIEVPDVTPAIVTPEIFNLAQQQLDLNRHKQPHNKKQNYLLSNGRLQCGICGRSMVGGSKKRVNSQYRYYRCVSNMKPNYYQHCDQGSISADIIESDVWQEISRVLQNPDRVLAELKAQQGNNKPVTLEADRMLIENNIKNSKTEEIIYLRKYGQGKISEAVYEMETRRVQKYRENQESKLAEIINKINEYTQATYNYEQFNEALKILAERLKGADYETKLLALEALNIHVTLQPDRRITISGSIPARERVIMQSHKFAQGRNNAGLNFVLSL